ncbi:MAG: type I methionyl aminopeptidase [Gallicola sp.]|nr:type I methionyl aminopeptidase [Gallicola sp.]
MIIIKTEEEIEKMDRAGDIVSGMHEALRDFIEVGKTTKEINDFCEEYIRSHGGIPSQINYQGYPYATCTSVNDEICHGFPTDYKLQNHDIITVDTVVELDGFLADSAWSYQVGEPTELTKKLMDVTKEALYIGIEQAVVGNRLGDIGSAIQDFVESHGFSVVREFTGHGIGKEMHEDPMVLHYGKAGRGQRLIEGMVLTIEPMVNTGKWNSKLDSNGWTARTVDKGLSCQYEHTLAITKDSPRILTLQKD